MIDLSKNPYLQNRVAGVSLPLSSMKGKDDWGCGDMASLKEWLAYFANYDIKILQILPIWETAPREHCPYSALSAYAIDPIYISIDNVPEVQQSKNAQEIIADLKPEIENWHNSTNVQFDAIKPAKYRVLWAAYEYFEKEEKHPDNPRWKAFLKFQKQHFSWLLSYAIFRTAKDLYNWSSWTTWTEELKNKQVPALKNFLVKNERQIMFFCYIQWIAQEQLEEARAFAKEKGISLFGDIPFGVNFDSADVWANQSKFLLDTEVGAPKDALAQGGQKWGLPAYNWPLIAEQNFNFWRARIERACEIYDIFRLDHLVGFFRTWVFKPGDEIGAYDLADEQAQKERGAKFIEAVAETAKDNLPVGEDLGVIPDYMREYMKEINMPGYRVIRWEKDNEVFREPRNYPAASLATTSTHDTTTLKQWWEEMPVWQRANFWEMISAQKTDGNLPYTQEVNIEILKRVLGSGSVFAIFPLQDIIGTADQINVPGTVNNSNWTYRLPYTTQEFEEKYNGIMTILQCLIRETNRVKENYDNNY